MPPLTRSRNQSKNNPAFCVLIDKTPRNIISEPGKDNTKPKKKPIQAKSKPKAKPSAEPSSIQVEAERENTPQPPVVGESDDPLRHVLSTARPLDLFATPPRSHPPPRPPKLPDHPPHDPKTTLPPQFGHDGTPSPEPRRRRSHPAPAHASPFLLPSSPIHLSSSPSRQVHHDITGSDLIFLSAHSPGSLSQFRTPTRREKKRNRTPLSNFHLQSEGQGNNDDLFAHGIIDDLDEREDWETAGSDKENHGGIFEFSGSEVSDNKPAAPSMPLTSERGILQPREASSSFARSNDSDPFGFFATERLLKARRAEKVLGRSGASSSDGRRRPRRPLEEFAPAKVAPDPVSVQVPGSPSQSQSAPAFPYPHYSDSEIEDLYAPASPPHTPRQRLPHGHATSPQLEITPVATTLPLTPRNGDSARAFTMRRRRQKELHDVERARRPPDPESQLDYDNQESEVEDRKPPEETKDQSKEKGKENARGKRLIMEDPTEAAKRILENAPRRKPKRRATAPRITSNLAEGTRSAAGQGSRGRKDSASRGRKKKGDESTPEDVRETRQQERLKHIEYFKELDGYALSEEKAQVYEEYVLGIANVWSGAKTFEGEGQALTARSALFDSDVSEPPTRAWPHGDGT
ncbi:hypothetical protein F5148DRAFT_1280741 [Russula earlei]|uniref:Uncharacterized protein n=1 Tax=Russula earlei TaxID=71964 RepID=A0ACC0UK81_9AGAM|nr:hypothetical protein F5148DRAFT_1280741 [Russula earlei]